MNGTVFENGEMDGLLEVLNFILVFWLDEDWLEKVDWLWFLFVLSAFSAVFTPQTSTFILLNVLIFGWGSFSYLYILYIGYIFKKLTMDCVYLFWNGNRVHFVTYSWHVFCENAALTWCWFLLRYLCVHSYSAALIAF